MAFSVVVIFERRLSMHKNKPPFTNRNFHPLIDNVLINGATINITCNSKSDLISVCP